MAKKVYLKGEEFVFSRVKGNKESTYRDGDINLTPANIGASAEGHTHDDRYYTESEINTKLNDKANSSHTHGNSDITGIDGSKITSGTIDLARLPQGALERLTVVADDTARFKLTSSTIQKGDTVKVTSTGKMYYVVDETKLSSEAGYEVYAAGTAASVPWSGVTGKPSTYTPSSHTHTKSQISDFPTSMPASDVYAWAKASSKPSYTKAEVGLGNVNNTSDASKRVDHANTASQLDHDLTFSICDGNGNVVSKEVFNGNTSKKIVVAKGGHTHSQYLTSDYDTKNCTTTFESGDSSTGSSTPPAVITSGETHKSLFNKLSTAVKNVRWLLSKMGTTDISAIGNGTVTGALSTLNSKIDGKAKFACTNWGNSLELNSIKCSSFILLASSDIFIIWLSSTNNVVIRHIASNKSVESSTGSATFNTLTVTRRNPIESLGCKITTTGYNTLVAIYY